MSAFEITLFEKRAGLLSKTIRLEDGKLRCDSSECWMSKGRAWRVRFDTMRQFADVIRGMTPAQALALGVMVEGVEEEARIVTKSKLQTKFGGAARPNLITRSLARIGRTAAAKTERKRRLPGPIKPRQPKDLLCVIPPPRRTPCRERLDRRELLLRPFDSGGRPRTRRRGGL
jgi:hypothetical protein